MTTEPIQLTDDEIVYLRGRLEIEADWGAEINGSDQSVIEGLLKRLSPPTEPQSDEADDEDPMGDMMGRNI